MSAPSGYTALDFVGFTDKGTYSPIVNYMRNDLVHYGGNIMRCLIDNTLNVTPVVGANWELWVGASANLVERVIAPLENNPADVAYGVGRQIIFDDWLWEVIAPIEVGDALIDYAVDPTNANIKKSAPVETQLLAVKAEADATDNMIAPTEVNASSSSAPYSVGDQLILNNILYDVIAAIQIGDALTTGSGGNIAAADTLTDQLNAKANSSDLATVATSGSYNDLSNKPTLGTAAAKDSTNAVTSGSTDLVESGAVESELANKLDNFENRKYLFIGDSYDSIVPNYSWIDIAAHLLGVSNYVNRAAGGYGFDPVSGYKWIDYLEAHPVDNPETITDIVIGGGTNDTTQTEANIRSAIGDFDDYIKLTFPNCKRVYLGYMGWSHLNSTQKGQHRTMMTVYLESAKALGWNFLNGVQYVLRNPKYILNTLADRVHPNASGVEQLGECVAMAIKDGTAEIRVAYSTAFTPNSAKVTGSNFNVAQVLYNGTLEFTTPDITLTAADSLSSYFTLATCPDLGSPINQYKYWMTYVAFSGNIYPAILVSFNPNELTLWLRGGITIPSGTQFQVGGFTYTDVS